jgi:thiamine-monophosphate kinase
MDEFDLIQEFFTWPQKHSSIALGPGDDCAILQCPAGRELCISTDTMVEGRHFLPDSPAELVAERALVAALSDLAAMAADPHCFSLALSLPELDVQWLKSFSQGLLQCAQRYHVDLIGGDTTRGPLTITIQVLGSAPIGESITRSGAQVGDLICVSGELGASAGGLACLQGRVSRDDALIDRYYKPEPRFDLAAGLRGRASALIDVSDGLIADLGHICQKSRVGAELAVNKLPVAAALANHFSEKQSLDLALRGGEDFELCFTLPPSLWPLPIEIAEKVSCIGEILSDSGIVDEQGLRLDQSAGGFRHFG